MNLLIADDHPIVRRGIKSMLSFEEGDYNIYESSNLSETMEAIKRQSIDLVLLDLRLGNDNGMDIINNARSVKPRVKYLILSSFISELDFIKGENLNVDGFMLKDAFAEDIVYAIKTIMRGRKYYDPTIMNYSKNFEKELMGKKLTEREKEILLEIGKGATNGDIASKFYLSESTVKKHVSSILCKLNFSHRAQVVYYLNSIKGGWY
ncbi:two component transcriptional regulator, LuxR family [Clostridium amylolyticum]|uniref:Stage 0 sporulation protein A homolog n=1 Tax=Clostridium amylolyticum TaxID=1121298 RepID=A0A1M6GRH6_9CLOT|nr:response regulator transcription factor [Clostridium amylolyticum]SHJ12533.1 two component transcriptional regulator, LuxR family [Clostridium amylolyticum]